MCVCFNVFNLNVEVKTEFIKEDSRDPQLHENLKSLGPVTIPPFVTKMKPVGFFFFNFLHLCERDTLTKTKIDEMLKRQIP